MNYFLCPGDILLRRASQQIVIRQWWICSSVVHILLAAVRAFFGASSDPTAYLSRFSLPICCIRSAGKWDVLYCSGTWILASLSATVAAGGTFHLFLSVSFLHQLWSVRWGRATHHYSHAAKQPKAWVSGFNPLIQSFLVVIHVLICCWGKLM